MVTTYDYGLEYVGEAEEEVIELPIYRKAADGLLDETGMQQFFWARGQIVEYISVESVPGEGADEPTTSAHAGAGAAPRSIPG
jgi:hypothetical protein